MSESNKPDWDDAPEWAQWVACDGSGKYKGQWWWFDAKPDNQGWLPGEWVNVGEDAKASGYKASLDWAEKNWANSAEQRPVPKPKNEYLTSPNKKRVTLFIEFDGPVSDCHGLADNVATALINQMNDGNISPGCQTVNRIKIAVGVEKMSEIIWDESDEEFKVKESTDE